MTSLSLAILLLITNDAFAQRRFQQRRAALSELEEGDDTPAVIPPGVRVVRDVAYSNDPLQRFDVYLPANPHNAPVIFMVHGGGWKRGDKAMKRVVENKVRYWVPKGFVFISTNYRMLPGTPVSEQEHDVMRAIDFAQKQAPSWGADPHRFILMGHSAGAHLAR